MSKQKVEWGCVECGHIQLKWTGQCPTCFQWNTFKEELKEAKIPERFAAQKGVKAKVTKLSDVKEEGYQRIQSKQPAFDRLLGHGLVPGSLILLGGDPGIGKSTLLLQITSGYALSHLKVLYICGEESIQQVSMRAKRLNIQADQLLLLAETDLSRIKQHIDHEKPDIVIVDSIQVIYKSELPSLPGSVAQIRECTTELMYVAKNQNTSIFLIGHVTKSGEIAGPRILEHLVDTVFYFEGDRENHFRILRVVKNRFGPCDEIGIFQMKSQGLEEVINPSEIFLEQYQQSMKGSAIIATLEGSCPILVEAQALVTEQAYSTPTRKCMGIDPNRLALLLAVLEKKAGYSMSRHDVFLALAGGIKVQETASDIGLLMAILSSFRNQPIKDNLVLVGEVGLGGHLRRVSQVEKRLKEAHRMGFTEAIIPKGNLKGLSESIKCSIKISGLDSVNEVIDYCLES